MTKRKEALAPVKANLPAKPRLREPTEKERRCLDEAADAVRGKIVEPPAIKASLSERGSVQMEAPFDRSASPGGWEAQFLVALGVKSGVLSGAYQSQLATMQARERESETVADDVATDLREGLAFVQSLEPDGGLQSALAVQMWATHTATMKLARLMNGAERMDQFEAYANLMNKTARSFAAQAEALTKARSGGKQQVEVRYVYVDARTQTYNAGRPGPDVGNQRLSHGPAALPGHAIAGGLSMWGQEPCGEPVSVAGCEGAEAVSDARRDEPGAEGRAG